MKLVTMLYVIHDMFLKVELNANKTDNHVIWYNSHIADIGIKHL